MKNLLSENVLFDVINDLTDSSLSDTNVFKVFNYVLVFDKSEAYFITWLSIFVVKLPLTTNWSVLF